MLPNQVPVGGSHCYITSGQRGAFGKFWCRPLTKQPLRLLFNVLLVYRLKLNKLTCSLVFSKPVSIILSSKFE